MRVLLALFCAFVAFKVSEEGKGKKRCPSLSLSLSLSKSVHVCVCVCVSLSVRARVFFCFAGSFTPWGNSTPLSNMDTKTHDCSTDSLESKTCSSSMERLLAQGEHSWQNQNNKQSNTDKRNTEGSGSSHIHGQPLICVSPLPHPRFLCILHFCCTFAAKIVHGCDFSCPQMCRLKPGLKTPPMVPSFVWILPFSK